MSFSNYAEAAVLDAAFKGVALPWAANTELWIVLHTADPGESGSLAAEASYTGYARKALTRSTDLTVTGNTLTNTNLEQFDQCTGGSNVITHISIADAATAGNVLVRATLSSPITVSDGVVPQFAASSISWILD